MLLDLVGLAGASTGTTLFILFLDFLMIIAGLISALVGSGDSASRKTIKLRPFATVTAPPDQNDRQ